MDDSEVIILLLDYLDGDSILRLSRVSKYLYGISTADDSPLWYKLTHQTGTLANSTGGMGTPIISMIWESSHERRDRASHPKERWKEDCERLHFWEDKLRYTSRVIPKRTWPYTVKYNHILGYNANFSNISLMNVEISTSILRGANLTNCHFSDVLFKYLNAYYAKFDNSTFKEFSIVHSSISGASFKGATITESSLTTGQFSRCDFTGATFKKNQYYCDSEHHRTDFSECNFTDADLKGEALLHVDFCGANLTRTDFRDAILQCANLKGVLLQDTILAKTNINGTIFDVGAEKIAMSEGAIVGRYVYGNGMEKEEKERSSLSDRDELPSEVEEYSASDDS